MKKSKRFYSNSQKVAATREGLLIATFGAKGELEDEAGNQIRCHIKKNGPAVIAGDRVLWVPEIDNSGTVLDHLPRSSVLYRSEHKNKKKLIAANIDALIIVAAPTPSVSDYLIDRYLVVAAMARIAAIILLNKTDLLTTENQSEVNATLCNYEKIGYPVLYSSTHTLHGLDALQKMISNITCILVGPTGVGKSSIISKLVPEQLIKIGETSAKGAGKHTTTLTRLYHLPCGANLIDSPGIREFCLEHLNVEEVANGFVEFKQLKSLCKFRNCLHLKEPGCAIQSAVAAGSIALKRYESYKKILQQSMAE